MPLKSSEVESEEIALKKNLETLFGDSKNVNSSDKKLRMSSRTKIANLLDWDKVAVVALGEKRWKSQKSLNKSNFKNLLKEIILLTAYERLDKFWADIKSYEITSIKITKNNAHVLSKFITKDNTYLLEYDMFRKSSKWYLDDIIFEGMKYSEIINEQIDEFLKENTFFELLNRLKKRKTELEKERN